MIVDRNRNIDVIDSDFLKISKAFVLKKGDVHLE